MVDRGQVQHGAESEGKMEDEVFFIRSNARVGPSHHRKEVPRALCLLRRA